MAADALQLALPDVARLAGVQRPVVTMWRKRSADSDLPFPDPVDADGDTERFDATRVVDWLEATGRGRNPEVRADLAAFSTLAAVSPDLFHPLTALLCLKAMTGVALGALDREDLLDLAEEADPDDELLFGEVEAVGPALGRLTDFTDRLVDAAYTPVAAFEKLMAERFRRRLAGHADVALTETAIALVTRVALALAAADGLTCFADPTPGGSDLLVSLLGTETVAPLTLRTPDLEDPASRLARRRLRVHDAARRGFAMGDDGAFELTDPAVLVGQLPTPSLPDMSPVEMLTRIDNVVLQMDDAQRAVLIGPAEVLESRLTDRPADDIRADLLRSGRVRAIVRLPPGLRTSKSRQAQAMWVLGLAHATVPIADRWTTTADLSGVDLTAPGVADGLVDDLVAAMGDRQTVRAHAFRFGLLVPTRTLLAADGDLVRTPVAAGRPSTFGAEAMLRLDTLLHAELPRADALSVRLRPALRDAAGGTGPARLDDIVRVGQVRVLPGTRINPQDLDTTSSVPVIGADEVLAGAIGPRRISRTTFSTRYPRARYTEPGDVVFCTAGGVSAMVDTEGLSAVAYPARILRIVPGAPLVAQLLAADIAAQPITARSWRRWLVRRIPAGQRDVLSDALGEIARRRTALAQRLVELDETATLIAAGVSTGALSLHPDHLNPPDRREP